MSVQTIQGTGEMVIIPREEYDALTKLAEDAEDVRLFTEATAAIEDGEDRGDSSAHGFRHRERDYPGRHDSPQDRGGAGL